MDSAGDASKKAIAVDTAKRLRVQIVVMVTTKLCALNNIKDVVQIGRINLGVIVSTGLDHHVIVRPAQNPETHQGVAHVHPVGRVGVQLQKESAPGHAKAHPIP
ncbi:unnamed protein product, partial [Heligmosomoides polygyrus]|uniref:Isochorismatase domain-containing protein n=1 Tax=Heligmosomoides polygyrus TaxID=6339 RepID=A0A183FCL7_HELPZ